MGTITALVLLAIVYLDGGEEMKGALKLSGVLVVLAGMATAILYFCS